MSADNPQLQPNRGQRRTLDPSVALNLVLYTPVSSWRYAICQVHVKQYNVTLSLNPKYSYGSSDKGSNVAVLRLLPGIIQYYPFYLRSENKDHSFEADIIVVPYTIGGKLNLHFLFSFKLCEFVYMILTLPSTREKAPFVNQDNAVYEFQYNLCGASYVRYTLKHLHQCIDEHNNLSPICRQAL